ncbi:MAG: hypothetical protein Q9212_006884 [Teloschistes hypoglaucus]
MSALAFSLNIENAARMHDAVQCLAKFSDVVSLEARSNHALLSVFKGRLGDRRDNDTAIERWRISANVLRSFLEYFGANTEQLAISAEDGRVAFTSYTEKIMNGKEILKHPLETSIAIDTLDFEEFSVVEKMLVAISVKDFRAIVLHAETLKTSVQAEYSFPTRPMQILYQEHGLQCEFTLATIGNHRGSSVTPVPMSIRNSPAIPTEARPLRPASVQPTQTTSSRVNDDRSREAMPPPSQPASRSFPQAPSIQPVPGNFQRESLSQRSSRPSPPPPKASLDPESLFLPAGDDDQQWDETNYDGNEDVLGWDASANQTNAVKETSTFRKPPSAFEDSIRRDPLPVWPDDAEERIAPTQRLSEIETLFSQ